MFPGNIITLISQYERNILNRCASRKPKLNLYEFIVKTFDGSLENTDSEPDNDFSQSSQETRRVHVDSSNDFCRSNKETSLSDAIHGGSPSKKPTTQRQSSLDYKANTP